MFDVHRGKYDKLVPILSLVNHIASGGTGDVTSEAVSRALKFATYLESHAARIYASGDAHNIEDAAKAILDRIRGGDLLDGFTLRDIHQANWKKLSRAHTDIQAALDKLVTLKWLIPVIQPSGQRGGRPTKVYRINPKIGV